MKFLTYLGFIVLVGLLSACAIGRKSEVLKKEVSYNPQEQAKIRLFGPYGRNAIRFYPKTDCKKWESSASKRAHTRWVGGFPKKIRNLSIGIPATQRTLAADNDTGIVFRDSYKEFVIPAGEEMVLDGAHSYPSVIRNEHCRFAVSFVPQAGKNYEGIYHWEDRGCRVVVSEILDNNRAPNEIHPTQDIRQTACKNAGVSY